MAARRPSQKKVSVDTHDGAPAQVMAHEIIAKFADLAPSVNRILASPLTDAGRLHAMTLFRDSLSSPGDPMRHPATAVAAGQAFDAAGS